MKRAVQLPIGSLYGILVVDEKPTAHDPRTVITIDIDGL